MSKRRNKRISRRNKDLRIAGRKNKELRYNQLQSKKEREQNARDYIAAADTQEEKQYRSEKYKAETLRRAYAKMRRIQAEQKREQSRRRKQDTTTPAGDSTQAGAVQSESSAGREIPCSSSLEMEIRGKDCAR